MVVTEFYGTAIEALIRNVVRDELRQLMEDGLERELRGLIRRVTDPEPGERGGGEGQEP